MPTKDVRVTPQTVIGLLIVTFGLLLTADNLGWMDAGAVLNYWPIALVAIGAAVTSNAADRGGRVLGGALMVVGGWLTLGRVFHLHIGIGDLWPLLLVAAGAVMIMRSRGASGPAGVTGDRPLVDFALWSGVERRITSASFRRADLTAVMGGIELDLRAASTADGTAVIDMFVMWGGIEITVPPDWDVQVQTLAIMGGVHNKGTGMETARHRLILRGVVLMGGVEIKT